jgi:hypothetical protein
MKRLPRSTVAVVLATVSVAAAGTWISAQKPSPPAPSPGTVPVETIPAGQRPQPAVPGDRGETYYWLEGEATRSTTTFADAVVISERRPDGDFTTRLTDLQGNELGRLTVDRMNAANNVVVYQPAQGTILRANARPGLRTTLDWGNEQAYSLWKDGSGNSATRFEWQGDVMRPAGGTGRDLKRRITELRTEWKGGLTARTVRKRASASNNLVDRTAAGSEVVVTSFTRDDVVIGTTVWDAEHQLFVWRFPGLSEGDVDASRLDDNGGWQFTPDMAWANIQALAFYQFHSDVNEHRQAARATPGWAGRLVGLVVPSLSANEPGCDRLHWLDSSVFRPCCDSHDRCYAKRGCGEWSWWSWTSSWQCDVCNLAVVGCFSTELRGPYYQYPWIYWFS